MAKKNRSNSAKIYFTARKASGKKHKRKTPKNKGGWVTAEMRTAYTPKGAASAKARVAGVNTREEAQLQRMFKGLRNAEQYAKNGIATTHRGRRVGSLGQLLKEALEAQ